MCKRDDLLFDFIHQGSWIAYFRWSICKACDRLYTCCGYVYMYCGQQKKKYLAWLLYTVEYGRAFVCNFLGWAPPCLPCTAPRHTRAPSCTAQWFANWCPSGRDQLDNLCLFIHTVSVLIAARTNVPCRLGSIQDGLSLEAKAMHGLPCAIWPEYGPGSRFSRRQQWAYMQREWHMELLISLAKLAAVLNSD